MGEAAGWWYCRNLKNWPMDAAFYKAQKDAAFFKAQKDAA
jgi:hypothetical protein